MPHNLAVNSRTGQVSMMFYGESPGMGLEINWIIQLHPLKPSNLWFRLGRGQTAAICENWTEL